MIMICSQSLLTHVSRATKQTLNKLGVFTVSSFHAFICARSPSLLNNLLTGRGATKRRPPILSRSNSASSRRSLQISRDEEKMVKVTIPENQVISFSNFPSYFFYEDFVYLFFHNISFIALCFHCFEKNVFNYILLSSQFYTTLIFFFASCFFPFLFSFNFFLYCFHSFNLLLLCFILFL